MKVRELLEHENWYQSKSLEAMLGLAIEHFDRDIALPSDFDRICGKNSNSVLKLAKDFLKYADSNKITVLGKPTTAGIKLAYGGGIEPKTDLCILANDKMYNISVKANDAYLFSAGTKTEYVGIVNAALELFYRYFPDTEANIVSSIKDELLTLADYIGPNFKLSGYTNSQLNKKINSWFSQEKLNKIKPHVASSAQDLQSDVIDIIKNDNINNVGDYKNKLLIAETNIKTILKNELISNNNFARCFFWEVITGNLKFGVDSGKFDKQSPAANTVANIGGMWHDVSSINSDYIINTSKHFAIRLQNVPRGWLGTFQTFSNRNNQVNAQDLANCLREIEFSLKIAPVRKKSITEFVDTGISATKFKQCINEIKTLSELLFALQIFPMIEGISN